MYAFNYKTRENNINMLIKPLYFEAVRHLYRFIMIPEYRKWCFLDAKLSKSKRFKQLKVHVNGWDLIIPDTASFLSSYREIFVDNIYNFESVTSTPKILDLGANIGLSILFFKKLFPESKITALEPDPNIFNCLRQNIHGNGFKDVNLINKAAWISDTVLKFDADGADGGRVVDNKKENLLEVEAIDVKKLLSENEFDFLKMDIEGAESEVFPACKEYLSNLNYIFLEYHSIIGQNQNLSEILGILNSEGFRVHIQSIMFSDAPFIIKRNISGFDNQLNIFAWKDNV